MPHRMGLDLELEDYRQEGIEVLHMLDWGLALVDCKQEELEVEGVPHRIGLDLELEGYRMSVPEMGFEVHHMMGWDFVLVDCRKAGLQVELGVVVPRKLV